ncbi:MAG: penicillin-binding protein 1A [Steroidobacteraceae bacterium]
MKLRLPKWLLVLTCLVATGVGSVLLALIGTFYYLKPTLPDVASIREIKLQVPLRIFSRDGVLIAQIGEQRRIPVRYPDLPDRVVQAFLAAEDDRFFEHPGIDWQGITRAVLFALGMPGPGGGGSTLTQQLVRTTLIQNEPTIRRKLREIFLSVTLEDELSKEEILELYLNTVFLGQRAYGVAAAAEIYFGKTLAELSIAEAALLAGIPQRPSSYNPIASRELAQGRRAYVLRRMYEQGFISADERRLALAEAVSGEISGPASALNAPYVAELVRLELLERYGDSIYTDGFVAYATVDSRLQWAADVALRSAMLEYDQRHGYRGPLRKAKLSPVETPDELVGLLEEVPAYGGLLPAVVIAVDPRSATVATRQRGVLELPLEQVRWARAALGRDRLGPPISSVAEVLERGDLVYVLPKGDGRAWLAQLPEAQGAMVAIDPVDGAIVALSGGFDYFASQFNRVTQARRQAGSGFKPFIYSAAIDNGFTPSSILLDAPVVYEAPEGADFSDWRPENDDSRFYGPIRLRDALARSRNLVSIRLMRAMGFDVAREHALRFGFDPEFVAKDLTIALGTAQVTPLEMATGFAAFANGGFGIKPYLVERVLDAEGLLLWEAAPMLACATCPEDAGLADGARYPRGSEAVTDSSTSIDEVGGSLEPPTDLRAPRVISAANAFIVTDMMRDVVRVGTARRALALGRSDLAGKTGTSNDVRDAWFAGFNPELVAVSWVGFDTERSLGAQEQGGRTALPMWIHFMREALRGQPEQRQAMPSGVVTARVSRITGQPTRWNDPDAVLDYFLEGQLEPSAASDQEAPPPAVPRPPSSQDPIF